jgi:hypothetical protein
VHHQDKAGNTVLHCVSPFGNVYIMIYLVTYLFSHNVTHVLLVKNKRR